MVVEAGLASELLSSFKDKEGNRAAQLALEVCKLVSVRLAYLFAVAESFLSALLAQEVLRIHVFAKGPLVVIHSAKVDLTAIVAVVQSCLIKHELGGLVEVWVTLGGHSATPVETFNTANILRFLHFQRPIGEAVVKELK